MVDPILASVAGLLLLAEYRWRWATLRILALTMAVILLVLSIDLGPASRRALSAPRQVQHLPESGHPRRVTDFASGVLVMKAEADRHLSMILLPGLMLVWLGITPMLRRQRAPDAH